MKISTKGRYAIRLMLELAMADPAVLQSVKTIAAHQDVSEKYLEQIISLLVKAGLVLSVRGAKGGYKLARAPRSYTAGEILRVTEGTLCPVACVDSAEACARTGACAAQWLWKKLDTAVSDVLDGTTLEQLADISREQTGSNYTI